jgi:hypothetical protein
MKEKRKYHRKIPIQRISRIFLNRVTSSPAPVDFNFGQSDEEEAGLSSASVKNDGKTKISQKKFKITL